MKVKEKKTSILVFPWKGHDFIYKQFGPRNNVEVLSFEKFRVKDMTVISLQSAFSSQNNL